MNILTDALPESVEIDGRDVPINADFRDCLRTILAFEDNELTPQEKQAVMLANLYPTPPANLPAAIERAQWFLNAGHQPEQADGSPRLYSFGKDAGYIFSAFRQTHGIDLTTAKLHWWTFLALFMDLGADTAFCNLVSLRKKVKTNQASKEERQAALEMGEMFDVPDMDDRTLEEKEREAEFMRLVEQGEKK